MAMDCFLHIEGVDGEATKAGFEKWIEIDNFSWGASNPTTIGPGTTGAAGGRVSLSSFSFMKRSDATSAEIFKHCCTGTHFEKATLKMMKATGDQPMEFITYDFTEVYVDSVSWSASRSDNEPAEAVTFAFGKIEVSYMPQTTTGSGGSPIRTGFDVTTGKPV